MEKKVLLFAFIVFFVRTAQAQWFDAPLLYIDDVKIMALYEISYKEDSNYLNFVSSEKMLLRVGSNVSDFQSYNRYRFNSVARKMRAEGNLFSWLQGTDMKDYSTGFTYVIYKNHPSGEITTIDRVFKVGNFQYSEKLDSFHWIVENEIKIIAGYHAQKATCDFGGRTWEAWFTDELPFNDGPYKFCGLPGLIIEISDNEGHYRFELISVEAPQKGEKIEWEEKPYVVTDKKGFFKVLDNSDVFLDPQTLEEQKNLKSLEKIRNNPIELDRK
jgi:GLPGLI family protein